MLLIGQMIVHDTEHLAVEREILKHCFTVFLSNLSTPQEKTCQLILDTDILYMKQTFTVGFFFYSLLSLFFCSSLPDCHEACSECRGPGQQECLSCSDPAALLRDGGCVSHCGAGFYSQDAVCYGELHHLQFNL